MFVRGDGGDDLCVCLCIVCVCVCMCVCVCVCVNDTHCGGEKECLQGGSCSLIHAVPRTTKTHTHTHNHTHTQIHVRVRVCLQGGSWPQIHAVPLPPLRPSPKNFRAKSKKSVEAGTRPIGGRGRGGSRGGLGGLGGGRCRDSYGTLSTFQNFWKRSAPLWRRRARVVS
jgi:hypothetical protein